MPQTDTETAENQNLKKKRASFVIVKAQAEKKNSPDFPDLRTKKKFFLTLV